jgi:hypothetical protein
MSHLIGNTDKTRAIPESDEAEIVRLRTENRLMRKALKMIQEKAPKRIYGGGSWAAGVAEQCFVQIGWIKP